MKLLMIRHGEAGPRLDDDLPGGADDDRHLTPSGRRRMRRGMKGLRRIVGDLDAIAHSPLPRAAESAEIVAEVFGAPSELLPDLAPNTGSSERLLNWIAAQPRKVTIALVAHEPTLSALAATFTTNGPAYFELKKGGTCLVQFDGPAAAGTGQLGWLMTARQLRACR